jgi:hypothetical protein
MSSRKNHSSFVVCLNNAGNEASLEVGKIYETLPDAEAESDGMIRVIDESGEDYLHAAARFYPVALPEELERLLLEAYGAAA